MMWCVGFVKTMRREKIKSKTSVNLKCHVQNQKRGCYEQEMDVGIRIGVVVGV
jgi:hypothetical protein